MRNNSSAALALAYESIDSLVLLAAFPSTPPLQSWLSLESLRCIPMHLLLAALGLLDLTRGLACDGALRDLAPSQQFLFAAMPLLCTDCGQLLRLYKKFTKYVLCQTVIAAKNPCYNAAVFTRRITWQHRLKFHKW